MASMESVFQLNTPYQDDKDQFYRFMNNNMEFLIPANMDINYEVDYLYVKSVINPARGKALKTLLEFKQAFNHIQENTMYQNMHKSMILYMIHKESNGSFVKLINRLKKFINDFEYSDMQYNKVKYAYEANYLEKGRYL